MGPYKEKNMIKYMLLWILFCYFESKLEDYFNKESGEKAKDKKVTR